MNPYILLVIGWILVLLEFYLPGMVMGITGGCMIIASIILIGTQSTSPIEILLFAVVAIGGLIAVVKFALWQIKGTKKKKSLYLDSDQTGYVASSINKHMIGKHGTALTDLKPGGYILIEGQKYQALSVSGYISKGDEVYVISGQQDSLNVKKYNKETSSSILQCLQQILVLNFTFCLSY